MFKGTKEAQQLRTGDRIWVNYAAYEVTQDYDPEGDGFASVALTSDLPGDPTGNHRKLGTPMWVWFKSPDTQVEVF